MQSDTAARPGGVLGAIERFGNRLPDPVFIFLILIAIVAGLSAVGALLGWSAHNPATGERIAVVSLFSSENLRRLFVDMPTTLTAFPPLGYVLVVMLGAGVAERSGLLATAMRAAVKDAPRVALTPLLIFVAIVSNHAIDAAYVALIPLAGVLYAAAGRHPIAGIAAAFAGVSGGFSANILPGQLDALLLGITEGAARILAPDFSVNIAGNWWFIIGMTVVFLPIAWFVTDAIIEPRLGPWRPAGAEDQAGARAGLTQQERRGLATAGVGVAAVVAGVTALTVPALWPDGAAPLYDSAALADGRPQEALTPFYKSLVASFFLVFLVGGVLYGAAAKTIHSHRDVVRMAGEAMADLGPYIVLAFVAAHFVALFNWSGLGAVTAIHGAEGLRDAGLPTPVLIGGIVVLTASINLIVGSASAKWAMLAPVLVPMLMLLGVSPEATTAAFRVGDSVTNIITPLMTYFPLVLVFCQRWRADFGMGSLMALMLPYSVGFLIGGLALAVGWIALEAPLGPNAPTHYALPEAETL